MYLLILSFPLAASLATGVFGGFLGARGSRWLGSTFMGLGFLLSLFIFYEVSLCGATTLLPLFDWCLLDSFSISWGLLFDSLSASMLLLVTLVSFFVYIYSLDYMSQDRALHRFLSYLSLFTFFMLLLVTADNLLQMFVAWEGVGLCSYLLINFWFTRILANKAALKAMLMNRIADVFLVMALLLSLLLFRTTDFFILFQLSPLVSSQAVAFLGVRVSLLSLLAFFLFLGAIGKSAQLGFHTWLPDAMEGPTPVSALLHAATMVTAGVFLLLRCSPLLEYAPAILQGVLILGGLTAWFFSLVGAFQYDVKRVIAYSTCSQLGYMFFSCGLSQYSLAAFHLFNHAFFKALLFLGAGALIHAWGEEQDLRRMGGLLVLLPFTYFSLLLASVALLGLPFLSGFYSKDLVLEAAYSRYLIDAHLVYALGVSAAFFTAVYSMRLLLLVFQQDETGLVNSYRPAFFLEATPRMQFSLMGLMLCSLFLGYLFSEAMVGYGSHFWGTSLFSLPASVVSLEGEYIAPKMRLLPVYLSLAGGIFAFTYKRVFSRQCDWVMQFYVESVIWAYKTIYAYDFTRMVYRYSIFLWGLSPSLYAAAHFNSFYNAVGLGLYAFSYERASKALDKGYLELLGPYGLYLFFRSWSGRLRSNPWALSWGVFFLFSSMCLSICFLFLCYSPIPFHSWGLLFSSLLYALEELAPFSKKEV